MKTAIIATALTVIAMGVPGCGQSTSKVVSTSGAPGAPAPTSAASKTPMGATVEITSSSNTAQVTVANPRRGTPSEFWPAKGTLWEVDATVVAKKGSWPVNPLYFQADTDDGTLVKAALGHSQDQITSGTLQEGQKATGAVGFDLPTGHSLRSVQLMPVLGSKPQATWTVQ